MFELNHRGPDAADFVALDASYFGEDAAAQAAADMEIWMGNRSTPLRSFPALAEQCGISELRVKDEGARLGLGSFKALGGAYAVFRLILEIARERLGLELAAKDFWRADVQAVAATLTFACATDGNHGRSVAAGAAKAGCRAAIFVHQGVDPERISAIAAYGAAIIQVQGNYDDAVAEARKVAHEEGWIILSDTSWPGYEHIPSVVMQGYTIMAREVLNVMDTPPTHLFLQAGVGGFAAAMAAYFTLRLGSNRPKLIIVEPERAACLLASNRAGRSVPITPGEPTCMAMLECYEPSMVAWQILSALADGFVTLAENEAPMAMNALARPLACDPSMVSGESGGTGLAALLQVASNVDARQHLGLTAESRVLVFNTEGATAPSQYLAYTGITPDSVESDWSASERA